MTASVDAPNFQEQPSQPDLRLPGTHRSDQHRARRASAALRLFVILLLIWILSGMLVIVQPGTRGILLRFGAIQPHELNEGLHVVLPVIDSIQPMMVRLRSHIQRTEAACRDLQNAGFELAVHWHLPPENAVQVFRWIGDDHTITDMVIIPAVEDSLKQVVAGFTAEQLISERVRVKESLMNLMTTRLAKHHLVLDGIDLLQLDFSEQFNQAVEAKQVAEQDARRAAYLVDKARRLAEARIQEAEGEAHAQQLLQQSLTPEILQREALQKWNGHLPLVIDSNTMSTFDFNRMMKLDKKQRP